MDREKKKMFNLWMDYDGFQYTINVLSDDEKTWVYAIDDDFKKCVDKAGSMMNCDPLEFINIVGDSDDIE